MVYPTRVLERQPKLFSEWFGLTKYRLAGREGAGMINTNAFDYINVLDKAMDASWLRNEAIANNIANVDTPN